MLKDKKSLKNPGTACELECACILTVLIINPVFLYPQLNKADHTYMFC